MPTTPKILKSLNFSVIKTFKDVALALGELFKELDRVHRLNRSDVERIEARGVTVAADHTAGTRNMILADGSSNTVTVTLPAAGNVKARAFTVKAIDITFTVKVATSGAETIDGAADYTFAAQYDFITLISDGSNWWIV